MFSVRQPEPAGKFSTDLQLQALARLLPQTLIQQVLADLGPRAYRERKLSREGVVWVLIAMNLFLDRPLGAVLEQLSQGHRLLQLPTPLAPPRPHALTYRRY